MNRPPPYAQSSHLPLRPETRRPPLLRSPPLEGPAAATDADGPTRQASPPRPPPQPPPRQPPRPLPLRRWFARPSPPPPPPSSPPARSSLRPQGSGPRSCLRRKPRGRAAPAAPATGRRTSSRPCRGRRSGNGAAALGHRRAGVRQARRREPCGVRTVHAYEPLHDVKPIYKKLLGIQNE